MIIFYFIFINFANNKIIDRHRKKSVHVFTGLSTGGDTANSEGQLLRAQDRSINVKANNTIYKQQTMFHPKLWAALLVKHIDLKDRGSSGK